VIDDIGASSQREIVEITVLPINDPPKFDAANATMSAFKYADNSTAAAVMITSAVSDIDFHFGRDLRVNYTLLQTVESGNRENHIESSAIEILGLFILPADSALGERAPCIVAPNSASIQCEGKVEKLNAWLKGGIFFRPVEGVTSVAILLNVSDLGNVDKLNRPLDANLTLLLELPATALIVNAVPTDNVAMIAGPIAGLLVGALIAGLIFALRRKRAKEEVEAYLDQFALGVEGQANNSPLYVDAAKGGESPIYVPSNGGNLPN